ncbi:MAG: hypothetical protein ACSNEK_08295 [Parachlamydiaceae bacterium]
MQIGQRLCQFFELNKFSELSHFKRFAVVGLTALSSLTIVGIIAAPFVWKYTTHLLSRKIQVVNSDDNATAMKTHGQFSRIASRSNRSETIGEENIERRDDADSEVEVVEAAAPNFSPLIIPNSVDQWEGEVLGFETAEADSFPEIPLPQEKLFQTFKGATLEKLVQSDEVGNYILQKSRGPLIRMIIHQKQGKPPLKVYIRKSSIRGGEEELCRYILPKSSGSLGFSVPLTKAQISTIIRMTQKPLDEFRLSTACLHFMDTGFPMFKKEKGDDQGYYIVNAQGAFQKLTEEQAHRLADFLTRINNAQYRGV